MDGILEDFLSNAYVTIDNAEITPNIVNNKIELVTPDFMDIIRVSCNEDSIVLVPNTYGEEYTCGFSDFCIDACVLAVVGAYTREANKRSQNQPQEVKVPLDLCEDEIDEKVEGDEHNFSRLNIDKIVSDLSVVVISKLVFEDKLIGYRFRLNNGCLDISIEKGKELGIVPYKIGKRVPLTAINGVLASKYECNNKVLFPDISSDYDLCDRLLKALLS